MGCAGYCNASDGLYVYWCLWGVQDIVMHQVVYIYIYWCLWGVHDSVMHQVVYMYIGVYGVCRIL